MIVVFAGTIGRSGLGGQAWANLQYLAGLQSLGHEVLYLEDCGGWSSVFDWENEEWTMELDYPARFVQHCLEPLGLGDRWLYRAGEDSRGMPLADFVEVCSRADLLLMRAVPLWDWRSEYDLPSRRAFIDVDPGFTQFKLASGDAGLSAAVDRCERLFTIAQRIGDPDCPIPITGRDWHRTAPPIALEHWPPALENGTAEPFTSVMRWQGFQDVEYEGLCYGQRDREFMKFLHLPQGTTQRLRLAVMGIDFEALTKYGWEVLHGEIISRTPAGYQTFVQESRAELAIPKHGYVASRGGWFSDRSVCYLASGRPVLTEDTGLADWLPVGCGIVTFTDAEGALAGIEQINASYGEHSAAARSLAESHFAADDVLGALLETALK
ncbi:MAG: glycosyltransferase family 1 protein [Actinobacteria bacterium]|nr:glycosyltransferase family 1 protein [Actinomycetota bacterium]